MPRYLTAGLAALAGFAMTAGVASADPLRAQPTDSASPDATTAARPKAELQYCIVDSLTGTRIAKRVCKTAREWRVEGVDPLNG